LLEGQQYDTIDIVAHSFGTYLAIRALQSPEFPADIQIRRAILCGSMLPPDENLSHLVGPNRRIGQIINDCGTKDNALLLTLFVSGVGMAGRLGLHGFQGQSLENRFFHFGHSGYFEGDGDRDAFMKCWWAPALLTDEPISGHDDLPERPTFMDRVWRALGENGGFVTFIFYAVILAIIGGSLFGLWRQAEHEREVAEANLARVFAERAWSALEKDEEDLDLAAKYALAGWKMAPRNEPHYRAPLSKILFSDPPKTSKRGHTGRIQTLVASRDGSHLVSSGDDGKFILWSTHPFKPLHTLEHAGREVLAASFNPDGLTASTVGSGGTVQIWDLKSGEQADELALNIGPFDKATAQFTTDGSYLVVEAHLSFSNSTDNDSLMKKARLQHIPQGGWATAFKWSRDKNTFEVQWAYSTNGSTGVVEFSHDGSLIATAAPNGFVYLVSTETGELKNVFNVDGVSTLGFSADSRVLFAGTKDRRVLLWDTFAPDDKPIELPEHEASIRAISVSTERARAYVIDTRGNAHVWDIKQAELLVLRPNSSEGAAVVKFRPDDGRFAIVGRDNETTSVWDTRAVRNIAELPVKSASAVLWMGNNVLIGDRFGNLTKFDLKNLTQSMDSLVDYACAHKSYRDATFSWSEAAADPLIREIWDPKGTRRKICQ